LSFYLVMLAPDGAGMMTDVPLPDYGPYDKGSEAAKFAKVLTDRLGKKVQPRRIAQAGDWREREAEKVANGTVTRLPTAWDLPPIKDHFAHVHSGNLIGFIESEELGVIGRVTAITAGRYISRFYPDVADDHRRRLIAAIDPSGEVRFATTPDEITQIYKEGPGSCMDAKESHGSFFDYPCWPTAPYGAGDLAVAYTLNSQGRIQSRCVCWPARKLFGRCYGDIQRMEAAMTAEGYENLRAGPSVDWKKLDGAKLLKVPSKAPFEYVMPYFDDIKFAVDIGDHFVTAVAEPEGAPGVRFCKTGGTTGLAPIYRWCPRLKTFRPEEDGFVFVNGPNIEWSDEAISAHTFVCDATGEVWPIEHRVLVYENGKRKSWSKTYFDQHGEYCSTSQKNKPKGAVVNPLRQDNRSPEERVDLFDPQFINELQRLQQTIDRDMIRRLVDGDFVVDAA